MVVEGDQEGKGEEENLAPLIHARGIRVPQYAHNGTALLPGTLVLEKAG